MKRHEAIERLGRHPMAHGRVVRNVLPSGKPGVGYRVLVPSDRELRDRYLRMMVAGHNILVNQRGAPVIEQSPALQWILKRKLAKRVRTPVPFVTCRDYTVERHTVLKITPAGVAYCKRHKIKPAPLKRQFGYVKIEK